jgi:hypothetical protein
LLDLDIGRLSRGRAEQRNHNGEDMAHGENGPQEKRSSISLPLQE